MEDRLKVTPLFMSTRLAPSQCLSPFAAKITLAGKEYSTRVDPVTKQRFIGDYELDAFVEHLTILGRYEALADLSRLGWRELRGRPSLGAAPRETTAWALHRARRRRF